MKRSFDRWVSLTRSIKLRASSTNIVTDLSSTAKILGVAAYESKKGNLEAAFGEMIESIDCGQEPGRVSVTLSRFRFPSRIDYEELEMDKKLPAESFYLGTSERGILTKIFLNCPIFSFREPRALAKAFLSMERFSES